MRKLLSSFLILLLFSGITYSQNTDDVILAKKIKINSNVLNEERTIFVSTPENYDNSKDSYPVMYVLDGSESTIHYVSGLVNDLSKRALCPKMIIVAIANTKRFRDMTPTKSNLNSQGKEVKWGSEYGEADNFLKFIKTELFLFIEKNYRTLPYKIFSGHSAGGMCVTHAFLSHNNMFNSYIAISPSLWWDSSLFNRIANEKIENMNLKHKHFYFSIGEKEAPHNVGNAHALFRTLTKKSPDELAWTFDYIKNEDHGSQATIALYNGLRFIYNNWKFDYDEVMASGLTYINNFYSKQSEKYGYEVLPSEDEMNSFGYALKRAHKLEEAINIFEKNTFNNPKSPNAFDSLAEAYLATGQFDLSIKNYEKAVELGIIFNDSNLDVYKLNLEKAKASKNQQK